MPLFKTSYILPISCAAIAYGALLLYRFHKYGHTEDLRAHLKFLGFYLISSNMRIDAYNFAVRLRNANRFNGERGLEKAKN